MAKTIHVFGLPRSGTNALAAFIRRNYEEKPQHVVDHDKMGTTGDWKHGPILHSREHLYRRYAIIHKHPIVWLVSWWQYLGVRETRGAWDVTDWHPEFNVWLKRHCFGHQTPLEWWNQQHRQWLQYAPPRRTAWVPHHVFCCDPTSILIALDLLQLTRRNGDIQRVTEYLSVNEEQRGNFADRLRWYSQRRWQELYSDESYDWVRSHVDAHVLSRLGYELEPPEYVVGAESDV